MNMKGQDDKHKLELELRQKQLRLRWDKSHKLKFNHWKQRKLFSGRARAKALSWSNFIAFFSKSILFVHWCGASDNTLKQYLGLKCMLLTEFNFNFLVVWSKDSKLAVGIWKQKTGIRIWVPELGIRGDKIQKFKFSIKRKDNFTQIWPGIRAYLGNIVLFSFQSLFNFHIDVLLRSYRKNTILNNVYTA